MRAILSVLLLCGVMVSGTSNAVNGGSVSIKGRIVESACSFSPDAGNQQIQLGQQPTHLFKARGDRSTSVQFNIKLADCSTNIATQALLTFGSNNDSSGKLFNTKGDATGVGVRILHNGSPINNGDSAKHHIIEGNIIPSYSVAFEANVDPSNTPITSGTANSWALLRVKYL
ncbi:type 1 fimbrial protein [Shewanella sp. VB17]|uniref:fimbrial protein n=1 Tax=Shewanella sp. VB17 TaxID=2739432 RepID=UPI001563C227|nr:fimbrial protein [Shewanella sp. VB17]NRD74176.1 type 1 fimbrial protein [Shewanella sp. VB17]